VSFDWTTRDIRTLNLLEGPEFDRQYNEYKGVVNGGFDHMNLPSQGGNITDTHMEDQSMVRYMSSNDVISTPNKQLHLPDGSAEALEHPAASGLYYEGVTANKYQGQWVDGLAVPMDVQEGLLQVQFNAWYWFHFDTNYVAGYSWAQFRLQLNDNTIAETGQIFRGRGNAHLVATVPVPQLVGATLTVGWRFAGPKDQATNNIPMFWWDGGTIFAINRYR
jgi:hypothetical protein